MRRQRLVGLTLAILLSLWPAAALADTHPYMKIGGGDVFAGGWFNQNTSGCSTGDSNYQAPTISSTSVNNPKEGGILTYAKSDRKGSSVDFGAIAMGLIEGDNSNQYGFYSGQTASYNSLSFANTETNLGNTYWGGYLAGTTPQTHCLQDYYSLKLSTSPPPAGVGSSFNIGSLASGQYAGPNGVVVDIAAGGTASIANGKSVTIFVNGNVYISHNIQYASGYTADNVPKLAVVVKGNIFIDPTVTQIDGLYIAQPSSGTNDGVIWTCHDGSSTTPSGFGYWMRSNCSNQLTVNGALLAKQVNFLRIGGDIANANANEANNSNNVAEDINFIPAMVIGGPFFNQPPNRNPTINSLVSLPPVF